MTAISNKDIAQAIYLASREKSHAEHSLFYSKVIQFLNKKRLLAKSGDILNHLSKIINEHEGRVIAKVSSAKKMSEKTNKELAESIIHRYSAKEITLIENIDEKLLGGYKVEVDDEVIDLTIRNKINKLQEYLTKPV